MKMDSLIETIVSNLRKNGFPAKKVSLPKTALESFVKKSDFDLDDVLGEMEQQEIFQRMDGERVVFSAEPLATPSGFDFENFNLDSLKNLDPETLKKQAQSFMETLTPEQKEEAFKKFSGMSVEDRNKLFEAAKKMGLS